MTPPGLLLPSVCCAPSVFTVTVNFATADGTATAGTDYQVEPAGTLTLPSWNYGPTAACEHPRRPSPWMSLIRKPSWWTAVSPANATIADAQGVGTILDDDLLPEPSRSTMIPSQKTPHSHPSPLRVRLSAASGREIRVDYTTADGTAIAGSDYPATSGTLTFPLGVTSGTIRVPIINDVLDEPSQDFCGQS